jgi:hypothetical protein
MGLSRLYEVNGIYERHEQTMWLKRKLLLAFFVPLTIPYMGESVKKCCFGGAGSISDISMRDSAGESLKYELLSKLSRLFD